MIYYINLIENTYFYLLAMELEKKYPFVNIVFEGGGVLGTAYQGAWEVLELHGIAPQIKRVCGTSAGTISATMIALGYSAEECKSILLDAPFRSFKDGGWLGLWRLFFRFGWNKGDKMESFFECLIEKKTKNRKSTFKDFNKMGFKDLRLVCTNLTQNKSAIFSHHHSPDMPVSEAMRISSSVPLFFEAKKYNGDLYVDGGVMRNYAISEFDKEHSMESTLGFFLIDPKNTLKPVKNLISYKEHLMASLKTALCIQIKSEPLDKRRTVFIDDLAIGALDFDISRDQRSDLMEQGRLATEKYLRKWDRIKDETI